MNITPFFEASLAIQIHMLAAIAAFVLGAVVLWRRKGGASHKLNGRIWVALMMVTALSGFFIHEIKLWGDYSPIHIISFLVPFGLINAILLARKGNISAHKNSMKATYVGGMLIAGGFTFLPGRLNHEIFFAQGGSDSISIGSWAFPIIIALLVFIYYYRRSLPSGRQG